MAFVFLTLVLMATVAHAVEDSPFPLTAPPSQQPVVTAESRYNDGLALAKKNEWRQAEAAYRDAIRLNAASPEAWNGLEYTLRKLGKYDESVRAYQEALRLRPRYPQALEYLGETYLSMGKIDDARAVLERLRPLGSSEANELAQAIEKASKR
jgi:tetratricopeptide (TPR) repeat protein